MFLDLFELKNANLPHLSFFGLKFMHLTQKNFHAFVFQYDEGPQKWKILGGCGAGTTIAKTKQTKTKTNTTQRDRHNTNTMQTMYKIMQVSFKLGNNV